jgi:hypothetical protein
MERKRVKDKLAGYTREQLEDTVISQAVANVQQTQQTDFERREKERAFALLEQHITGSNREDERIILAHLRLL